MPKRKMTSEQTTFRTPLKRNCGFLEVVIRLYWTILASYRLLNLSTSPWNLPENIPKSPEQFPKHVPNTAHNSSNHVPITPSKRPPKHMPEHLPDNLSFVSMWAFTNLHMLYLFGFLLNYSLFLGNALPCLGIRRNCLRRVRDMLQNVLVALFGICLRKFTTECLWLFGSLFAMFGACWEILRSECIIARQIYKPLISMVEKIQKTCKHLWDTYVDKPYTINSIW